MVPTTEIEGAAREAGRIVCDAVLIAAVPAAELLQLCPRLDVDAAEAVFRRRVEAARRTAADQLQALSPAVDLRGAASAKPDAGDES